MIVDEAPGGPDEDVEPLLDHAPLPVVARAPVDDPHGEPGMAADGHRVLVDLDGELAGRRDDVDSGPARRSAPGAGGRGVRGGVRGGVPSLPVRRAASARRLLRLRREEAAPRRTRSMAAMRKAAVLPVPVRAWPATSRPARASGRAWAWMGVQRSNPASFTPLRRAGTSPMSSNRASEKMPAGPAGSASSGRLQSLFKLFPMGRTPPQ